MLKTFLGRLNEGWLTFRGREEETGARPIEQYFPANGGSPHTPESGALPHTPFAGLHIPRDKIDWPRLYMGLAFAVAHGRSFDQSSRHGCFLADKYWRPISFGYNSPPRKLPDHLIPNTKGDEDKYLIVSGTHAESNAMDNAGRDFCAMEGVKCVVTGIPCCSCSGRLINNNILEWYVADRRGYSNENERARRVRDFFVRERGVKIEYIDVGEAEWVKYISFE